MNKKKPLCMMLIVILIMQIILPTLTVVFESGITLKSIAEGTLETTVNGITWTYILKDGQATEVKPKDKTSLSGSVIIPSQLDGYTVTSIGFRAFYECSSLISIQIPEGVTSIGDGAFSACSSLTTIEVNEENTIYKSNNGVLYTKDGTQIICYPAKREGTEYKILDGVRSIGDYAFRGCGNLTSIEIPNGVTSISGGAFNGCSNLTSIEIPNGVKIIDIETFMYCSSLISIQIPDGVTSIRDSAFLGCSSLENIEIPEGVTSIGFRAFLGCSSLENIEIPEGVTSIGDSAFEDCSNLTSIKIPAGVTNIGDSAFEDCSNLTSIKIPAGVTSIGDSAFEDCSNLTSIEIPAGVTSIGDSAFSGCSSLTNIEIPEGVTSIGGSTFYGCSSLISIEIPEGVTSIGSWAFYNCSSLTNIVIPAEVGAYAFLGCTGLKSIVISEGVTEINCISIYNLSNLMSIEVAEKNIKYKSDEGVLYTKDGTKIILYPLKKEGTEYRILDEVTEIGEKAFRGCSSLENIEIPEGVTSIGDSAFSGCSSLTSIEIPDGVTSIGSWAFYECSSLTNIEIPEGVTSIGNSAFSGCSSLTNIEIPVRVTSIGQLAFSGCSSLTNIEIPNGVTSIEGRTFYGCNSLTDIEIPNGVVSIGDGAFQDCSSLADIEIPDGVTSIGQYVFSGCNSLISIEVDQKNTKYKSDNGVLYTKCGKELICYPAKKEGTEYIIPDGVTNIWSYAFERCSSLINIEIPDGVIYIGHSTFDGCSSLISIEIPEGVTSIGSWAFFGCSSLISIEIPEGVTSIGNSAFDGCSSLTSIEIPEGVTSIGYSAFNDCSNLTSIEIPNGVTSIENTTFLGCKNLESIVIPAGLTSIKSMAFSGCKNLESIAIPEGVISIENTAFSGCVNLKIYCKSDSFAESYAISKNIPYIIDDVSPIIISVMGISDEWKKDNVTLTVNAEDSISGLSTKAYSFDGGITWQESNSKTYTENTNNIIKKVKDKVNNITTYEKIDITKIIKLTGITVTNVPTKTTYIEGQNFDKTGMVVTAIYDNGLSEEITNYTIADGNNLALGKTSVTISYTENGVTKTVVQVITVQAKTLTGITVTKAPTKTTYIEGQNFDKTGMVVTAAYNNGATQAVTNYTVADGNNLALGKTSVTISYTENGVTKTAVQGITVQAKTLTGITVTKAPIKTVYLEGQNFDKTGMVVTAMYDNGLSKEITNYTITDGNNLTLGKTSAIINYTENGVTKTVTQGITVTKKLEIKLDVYEEKQEGTTKYVGNIKPETTIENILKDIDTNGTVEIYKGTSKITDLNTKIGTGMTIKISLNNEKIEYTAVVTGDLNGDGLMGDIDVLRMARYKAGLDNSLNGAYLQASNIHKDNNYADDIDLLKMVRILVGLDTM